MTNEQPLTAAGGWCAPLTTMYDASLLQERAYDVVSAFPEVSVQRGGFHFDHSPEARAAADALRAQVTRLAQQMAEQEYALIAEACAVATANGWDVHLYRHERLHWSARDPNTYRAYHRVGIEFQPARYGIPTVIEHDPYDASWDDD